jgi:hypothetical protein
VNDIVSIADNLDPTRNQNFAYDPDHRLTQATGNYGLDMFGYDPDGNRVLRRTSVFRGSILMSSPACTTT